MEYIRLLAAGIAIGMANVIPGVSGGTLAVVFNIYDRFINAITYNIKALWNNRGFIIPLAAGMGIGVLIFSKLITVLYTNFPVQTNFFFTGLIAGSIPLLCGFMLKKDDDSKLSAATIAGIILCVIAGISLILTFAYLQGTAGNSPVLPEELPPVTAKLLLLCFFAGFAGAVAMVIPGISGSLIMLILGVYPIIMKCIPAVFVPSTFIHAAVLIAPAALGILTGLISGAKLVALLLKKVPSFTYAVILGLIIGSAYTLYPGFKDCPSTGTKFISVVLLIAGAALSFLSTKVPAEEENSDNNN